MPKSDNTAAPSGQDHGSIEIIGAREHNLKNIDVSLPRHKLIVITGVSGSGKSSLAFDTIYAEGKRRYMESFSAYARRFIGTMERPNVDHISGLSPVIAIEQKTTSRHPRATVGTTTEIYDFLRLLFARAAEAYSYKSGKKMQTQTEEQIQQHVLQFFAKQTIILLAPVIRSRKGHYRELFQRISQLGFDKVRVDGTIVPITPNLKVDRYQQHNIEIVIDCIDVNEANKGRLQQSLRTAWKQGKGTILIQDAVTDKLFYFSKALMDPETGLSYDQPTPNTFSFNSPRGACPSCNGLGEIKQLNMKALIPDRSKSIHAGGIIALSSYREVMIFKQIEAMLQKHQYNLHTPIQELPHAVMNAILYGDGSKLAVSSVKYPGMTWNTHFEGVLASLKQQLERKKQSNKTTETAWEHTIVCKACEGTRLKKESRHFKLAGQHIGTLAAMNMQQLYNWICMLPQKLNERQQKIASEPLKEIKKRIRFLLDVGLPYLHLNRPLRTISGGEAQRIRLATQIGTQLVGVLYILDEPSIGLHQRDNMRLIQALKQLRDLGNSVIVVEHDQDMMLQADYILDIGPGAGQQGGRVVAMGSPQFILQQNSSTAKFLRGETQIVVPLERRVSTAKRLIIHNCLGNNLKNITLNIPLGNFVCITGVSGSGKSSLIHHTLVPILKRFFYKSNVTPLQHGRVEGLAYIDKVIEIDQTPIGRTPRSNPATYTGLFTEIRNLFAQIPESKIRGYSSGRFSFNVKGGRCETCEGVGVKTIEMDFLPTVYIPCEVCQGKRYNRETLEIQYKGKSIADILAMTVSESVTFFAHYPRIHRQVSTLEAVGLGYITLGQHATTLSGGEAQRIKLATELAKKSTSRTLYILDEPTTGLHIQDISLLLNLLNNLVNKGNTVLVIEHNMDVIKLADHVIDLGPEGGPEGGQIMAEGTPESVAGKAESHTGKYLKHALA